jgi:hypothetical protein
VNSLLSQLHDPLKLGAFLWPQVQFYDKQRQIIRSFEDNFETYIPSSNKAGKDFVGGFLGATWFLRHWPCRGIITSVKDEHTDILWGELRRFIKTAKYPLESKDGGPLVLYDREIRRIVNGKVCEVSYIKRQCWEEEESGAGHHSPYSFLMGDEATALDDSIHSHAMRWAKRMLWIFNCNPTENFVKRAVDAGDVLNDRRKVA